MAIHMISFSFILFSLECCTNRRTNTITIINVFYFFVFSSLIDSGIACLNSQLTWTCPGGYLQVQKANWETHENCGSNSDYTGGSVIAHLQNKCNNKTTCNFNATDSNFNVSCSKCTGLEYYYKCISKSLITFIVKYFSHQFY